MIPVTKPTVAAGSESGKIPVNVLVKLLAVIGSITVLFVFGGAVGSRFGDSAVTGTVKNEEGLPVAGVPVFLDRGMVIERYVTDSAGDFGLPVSLDERPRIAWMICAPGSLPMVGHNRGRMRGHVTYGLNHRDVRPGGQVPVRGFGWSGPIPRECPMADSMTYWRGPVDSASVGTPMLPVEPDWKTYRSKP